jgi:hypothetical protein
MNANLDFAEQVQVVSGFLPVNMATAANTGDFISLKNYEKVTIVFFKGTGTGGDDPTLTNQEATAVDGSDNTNLAVIDKIYAKQAATDLTSTGTFTVRTQTAAATFVGDATSAEEAGLYLIDVYASDLSAGFTCINASVGDIGTNAQIGALLYFLWPARYGEQALLSAIVD